MGAKFWKTVRFARVVSKIAMEAKRARVAHWAVAGGNAADYWSNPPATTDVDIVVSAKPSAFWSMVGALASRHGFSFRQDPYKGTGGWPGLAMMLDRREGVDVDMMFPAVSVERRAAETAVPARAGGAAFRVVRPEYLVAMKLAAGRPKDIRACAQVMAAAKSQMDFALLDDLLVEAVASPSVVKMARILAAWHRKGKA